jgi:hypothetical protein
MVVGAPTRRAEPAQRFPPNPVRGGSGYADSALRTNVYSAPGFQRNPVSLRAITMRWISDVPS